MARPAHLTVNKLTEVADACQKKECSAPLIAPEEIDPRQTRDRYTLEETETKNGVPLFALKEGLASCSFQNAAVTKPETASSPVPSKWEGSATAQAAGLQLVRICRDVCHEQELPHHVLVNTASNESQKAPCKTHQAHERDLCCMRNLKLPLGKKDRYTMHFPSPYGESDCSSAATKPQEDEISRSGGRTAAKHIEDGAKLHTSTKAVNAELIEDEDPTISAVWALQQAEVEEEKRLLLLEMSQHVIERQAETRRRERNLQSELMAQHSQNEQHNRHEGFDCCSPSLEKRKPGVEAYVVAMNAVNEPLVRKIEHSSGQKPSDSGSCRKVPSHFHVSLPLAKGGSLQNARATQPIQERKHFRWGPASLALNASRTAPKPMQNALAPSRNSLDVATLAEGTTSEEKKVLDNGQHQQLHGDFPVKQQQALIGQLLGHGLLAGQTRAGLLEITKAAVCSPDKSFCYHRDKYNACLQARALQRRAVLQALQQLLLFPSKTSHRNTLKKGYRHEKEERVPTQEGQKGVISQRNYQRQISTGQPRHSASSAVENTVPEGNHSKGPLFCRSSSISRGAARLSSPLSTPGRVEQ
ncbi:hypothetical protein, conserved [Eimeria brunetti]|uniref:Uncharacterized protein n=1 Tax=Eimeria brunetti TaxID=51314 RepID=U6LZR7_9EIME|nr:hypothetical protein, conserved [Eimeria brunetti]